MTRPDAFEALNSLIKNPNLIKHHLACEAIMLSLCTKLVPKADEITKDRWGITGLLHDADYELTRDNPKMHTLVLEEKLGDQLDKDVLRAIKAHNFQNNGVEPKSSMDWSMYCCDELSGLIIAAALIHPDKKLSALDTKFILKRFDERTFAMGASRDQIKLCEEKLGIPLEEFIQISLSAMQGISTKLNL